MDNIEIIQGLWRAGNRRVIDLKMSTQGLANWQDYYHPPYKIVPSDKKEDTLDLGKEPHIYEVPFQMETGTETDPFNGYLVFASNLLPHESFHITHTNTFIILQPVWDFIAEYDKDLNPTDYSFFKIKIKTWEQNLFTSMVNSYRTQANPYIFSPIMFPATTGCLYTRNQGYEEFDVDTTNRNDYLMHAINSYIVPTISANSDGLTMTWDANLSEEAVGLKNTYNITSAQCRWYPMNTKNTNWFFSTGSYTQPLTNSSTTYLGNGVVPATENVMVETLSVSRDIHEELFLDARTSLTSTNLAEQTIYSYTINIQYEPQVKQAGEDSNLPTAQVLLW